MLEITQSEIATFKNCRTKWYLSYIELLTPLVPAPALEDGTIFHDAIELHYKKTPVVEVGSFIQDAYRKLMTELNVPLTPELIESYEKRRKILQAMVLGYIINYEEVDGEWEVINTEEEFAVEVVSQKPRIKFILRGKRDANIMEGPYRFIVEHKTTATLAATYIEQYEMNQQLVTYLWSDWKEKGSERAEGIILNACLKSKLRQKKTEDSGEFLKRVTDAYINEPQKHFFREPFRMSLKKFEKFERSVVRIARQMEEAIKQPNLNVYKNEGHCHTYGKCPYLAICKSGSKEGPHMGAFYKRDKKHQELGNKETSK